MERFVQNIAFCNPDIFKTMPYSEPEEYLESWQASVMQRFLSILYNPGIFRILPYSKLKEYSERLQASMI